MQRFFLLFAVACSAFARPAERLHRRQGFTLANGQDAIALNKKFDGLNENSPCSTGENACVQGKFAQCVDGRFVVQGCAPGTICAALPLVNSPGTSITCTTRADVDARIAATGATGGGGGGSQGPNAPAAPAPPTAPSTSPSSPDTSLTLDPAVIAKGFANDGQSTPSPGQIASLTSTNNFINFCKTINLPITNGAQITDGSCNPAPMGAIPAKGKMPASKFVFPANGGKVAPKTKFTIQMAIQNLETGNFVNANQNYFSAPQQLNGQGLIRGHSHVVIQKLESLAQTTPLEPTIFEFFKGLNGADNNGILTADVTDGLAPGFYRLASINSAANHQPVLVPVAQHGSLDDIVYFTVE